MQTTISTLLITAVLVPGAQGYSSGAPDNTCNSMRPNHPLDPLENPPPFSVTVSSDNYQANVPLQVQIVASPGRTFKGFMIQARAAGNLNNVDKRVGDFVPIDGTQSVCGTNGLTHTSRLSANTITINWSTASELQGDIIFRATVVESFSLWYAGIDSKVITAGVPTTTTTTTLAPTTIITTTTLVPTTTAAATPVAATSPSTTTTTTTPEQTLFQTTPSNTRNEKNTVSTPPKSTTATGTTKATSDSASDPMTSSRTTSQPTITSTTPGSEVVQGDDVSGTGDAGQSPSSIITGSKDNQNPDSSNGAKLVVSSSRLLLTIVFVSCLFSLIWQ